MRFGRAQRRASALGLATVVIALLAPSGASAATITNGGFEVSAFGGWTLQPAGAGNWFEYSGTTSPLSTGTIPAPPQGMFAAISDESTPGTHILYQDIALDPNATHQLSLIAYYHSNTPIAVPNQGTLTEIGATNQQYRIDVMKPSAAADSIAPSDILLNVFQTKVGDPTTMAPTKFTADLTPFAGQTVRLRFAEVDNSGNFNAGTDAVSLASTSFPSAFTFGKAKKKKKNGTAMLTVNVPGPGTVSLSGKGVKPQRLARESGATASKAVAAAGAVKLLVKAKGKARKKLNKTGKVKVAVQVTFAPTAPIAVAPTVQTEHLKLVKKLG